MAETAVSAEMLRVAQWLYWGALLSVCIGFLMRLVYSKPLSRFGAFLGFMGTVMIFAGFDSLVGACLAWATDGTHVEYMWRSLASLEEAPAMIFTLTGAALCWITEDSAFFLRPDAREAWYSTRHKR